MANVTVIEKEEEDDENKDLDEKDKELDDSLKIDENKNADENVEVFKMPDYLEGSGTALPEKVIMYPKNLGQGGDSEDFSVSASSAHLSKKLQFLVEKYTTQRTLQVNKVTINAMGLLMRNLSSDGLLNFKGGG